MTSPWYTTLLHNLELAHLHLSGPTHRDLPYARVKGTATSKEEKENGNLTPHAQTLHLDLYLPFFTQNAPLVISLHGGGWQQGTRKDAGTNWLVAHGFAVANVQHRLTHQAQFPSQIHDLKAAIRWLRAHATEIGYNATRIGIAGISSGGHLAMLAGTTNHHPTLEGTLGNHLDQDSSVQAIVNYFGASDLLLRAQTQPTHTDPPHSVVHKLLGNSPNANPEKAQQASPAHHVDQASQAEKKPASQPAPLYVLHGEQDPQVKIDQAHRIIQAYKEKDAPLQHLLLPKSGHGGPEFFTPSLRQSIATFLKKHLNPATQQKQNPL